MVSREIYQLTDIEFRQKQRLPREFGAAIKFWQKVSERLGIDYQTIMPNYDEPHSKRSFTALQKGHNKHWCWPMPLKCKTDPATVHLEDYEFDYS